MQGAQPPELICDGCDFCLLEVTRHPHHFLYHHFIFKKPGLVKLQLSWRTDNGPVTHSIATEVVTGPCKTIALINKEGSGHIHSNAHTVDVDEGQQTAPLTLQLLDILGYVCTSQVMEAMVTWTEHAELAVLSPDSHRQRKFVKEKSDIKTGTVTLPSLIFRGPPGQYALDISVNGQSMQQKLIINLLADEYQPKSLKMFWPAEHAAPEAMAVDYAADGGCGLVELPEHLNLEAGSLLPTLSVRLYSISGTELPTSPVAYDTDIVLSLRIYTKKVKVTPLIAPAGKLCFENLHIPNDAGEYTMQVFFKVRKYPEEVVKFYGMTVLPCRGPLCLGFADEEIADVAVSNIAGSNQLTERVMAVVVEDKFGNVVKPSPELVGPLAFTVVPMVAGSNEHEPVPSVQMATTVTFTGDRAEIPPLFIEEGCAGTDGTYKLLIALADRPEIAPVACTFVFSNNVQKLQQKQERLAKRVVR